MTRPKGPPGSPTLQLTISDEQYQQAVQSASGGCLIADAIKEQYPHLSAITVDMATIRATDRAKGVRYTYLTPAPAQHLLLSFDQGWRQPVETLRISRAVKIDRMTKSPSSIRKEEQHRTTRIKELQAKLNRGEKLTNGESVALNRMTDPNRKPRVPRPTARGPVTDVITSGNEPATVIGGEPLPQGKAHPNLLRGRDRHFGAKLADPGQAFNEAVEQAVAQRLAQPES